MSTRQVRVASLVILVMALGGVVTVFLKTRPDSTPAHGAHSSSVDDERDDIAPVSVDRSTDSTTRRTTVIPDSQLSLAIKTLDQSGRPIAGASIYGATSSGSVLVGTTDIDVGLALVETPTQETEFVAFADGFCPQSRRWAEARDGLLEIIMSPGFSINGLVVRSVEKTPVPEVHVAVWPKGRVPELSAFDTLDPHDPLLLNSLTDDGGRFQISGLPEGRDFEVVAGGKGLGTLRTQVGRSGDSFVLEVSAIYAASIQLMDEGGGPLAVSANFFPNSPPSWDTKIDEGNWIRGMVPGTVLAGLPVDALTFKGPYEKTFVMTSSSALKRLGPVVVSSAIPGYVPNSTSVWVDSLEIGPLSNNTVKLKRANDVGFGEVRIFLDHIVPLANAPVAREQAIGTLILRDPVTNERQSQIAIYSLSQPSPIIARLPAGTFTTRYVARNGFYSSPPESEPALTLTVSDVPTELHFDLSLLGHVEIVVLNHDSTPYSGPWTCGLKKLTELGFETAGNPITFPAGPYFLEGLPEGTYRFQYGSQVPVSSAVEQATFSIGAGTTTVHVVPLDR